MTIQIIALMLLNFVQGWGTEVHVCVIVSVESQQRTVFTDIRAVTFALYHQSLPC